MSHKIDVSAATLLVFAMLGLALSSALYIYAPSWLPQDKPIQSLGSTKEIAATLTEILLPFTLAFFVGFFRFRLPILSCIVLLRFFSLINLCYIQFYAENQIQFFKQIVFAGIQGLLFLSFCRLTCIFGCAYQNTHKKRFIFRYMGDYLFFCGLGCVWHILPHIKDLFRLLITHTEKFTMKGY